MSAWPLCDQYLPHLDPAAEDDVIDRARLETALGAFVAAAAAAWPALGIPPRVLLPYAAARLPADVAVAPPAERAPDLCLACGCARGVPEALGAFERLYLADVPRIVARVDASPEFGLEVQSLLRTRLLSPGPGGAPPRIADYRGRGGLGGWVRVAALRLALNQVRGRRRRREDLGAALPAPRGGGDAELDLIRERYREEFEEAVGEALGDLPAADKNLLRLRFLDGVGSGRLAGLLGVDRSTVVRRLQAAREQVFTGVRRRLKERLRIDSQEFESLLRLVRTDLDVSLSVFLDEPSA